MSYREIALTEVSEGAPLTQNLMQQLRDNQEGIKNGLDGYPKVTATAHPLATSTANTKNNLIFCSGVAALSNTLGQSGQFSAFRAGSYAVHIVSSRFSGAAIKAVLLKNDANVDETAVSTSTVDSWSQQTLAEGDTLKVQANNAAATSSGQAFIFIYVDNPIGDSVGHNMGLFRATPQNASKATILNDTY